MSCEDEQKKEGQFHRMANAIEFDRKNCIGCGACVASCNRIGINFLKLAQEGDRKHVEYTCDPNIDCVYCGQCTFLCPVKTIYIQDHTAELEAALSDKNKITIVQMAPSVRVSIGEEFGLPPGTDVTKKMYTALRQLGFSKVFDVTMGADLTTYVEAMELMDRIRNNGVLPMFTSCCPSWVKYVEFHYPQLIPNLTTARSPHIHAGGAYKTWWAQKEGIDPKNIVVVSLHPCTSKKYEAKMEKFKIDGLFPVDIVVTAREMAALLKKRGIDIKNLPESEVDSYGQYSGAGVIYGAAGGVTESALRTAYFFHTGKELEPIDFKDVRDTEGIKKATVEIAGKKLNIAIVFLPKNAEAIIQEVLKDPKAYDYIEVMNCPGGCVGGGGQPKPTNSKIIAERKKALYQADAGSKIRRAHENPLVTEFFHEFIEKLPEEQAHGLLHTHYQQREKFN